MTSLLFRIVRSNGQTEQVTVPLDDAELLAGAVLVGTSARESGSTLVRRLYEAIADNHADVVIGGGDRAYIHAALVHMEDISSLSQPLIDLRVLTAD